MMYEVQTAETIKTLMKPFLDAGFQFEYTHQKGGDSSCVYIFRFKKGKDYFDWREVSGTDELHLIVYARGEFQFPDAKKIDKKSVRAFALKHLLKKATISERRELFARLLVKRLHSGESHFYGIAL